MARLKHLPKTLTREEASRLLSQPSRRYPTGIRNRALLRVFYRAGLRCSEALELRVQAPRSDRVHSGRDEARADRSRAGERAIRQRRAPRRAPPAPCREVVGRQTHALNELGRRPRCDWCDCGHTATHRLRFGRVNHCRQPAESGRHLLSACYCDDHADQVRELYIVESELELRAAPAAA